MTSYIRFCKFGARKLTSEVAKVLLVSPVCLSVVMLQTISVFGGLKEQQIFKILWVRKWGSVVRLFSSLLGYPMSFHCIHL